MPPTVVEKTEEGVGVAREGVIRNSIVFVLHHTGSGAGRPSIPSTEPGLLLALFT